MYLATFDSEKSLKASLNAIKIIRAYFQTDLSVINNTEKIAENIYNAKDYEKAIEIAFECLEKKLEMVGDDTNKLVSAYHLITKIYISLKEYPLAIDYNKKIIEILEKNISVHYAELGMAYMLNGELYEKLFDRAQAIAAYKKAKKIFKDHSYLELSIEISQRLANLYI